MLLYSLNDQFVIEGIGGGLVELGREKRLKVKAWKQKMRGTLKGSIKLEEFFMRKL